MTTKGVGPWKGVRDLKDPFAVPPDYLRRARNMYIPDPKGGSGIYSRPGFRRVAELVGVPVSEAILRARVAWTDGFDLGLSEVPSEFASPSVDALNRYSSAHGTWAFHLTGGRDGGGYVESIVNPIADNGHYIFAARPTATAGNGMVGDPTPTQGGMSVAFNLFGATLAAPMVVMSALATISVGTRPHVMLAILPDLRVRVYRVDGPTLTTLFTSSATVPADGWFKIEWQYAISPTSNARAGYVLAKLYTLASPLGSVIGRAIRVRTNNTSFAATIIGEAFGTCAIAGTGAGQGVGGIGMDDMIVCYGDGVIKRFLQDTYVGTTLPAGPGTHTESEVEYDDTGETQFTGFVHVFGDVDRWRNVSRINPLAPRLDYTPVCVAPAQGLYDRSPFTSTWTDGEPGYQNSNGSKYNHFKQSGIDTFPIGALRPTVHSILVVAPAILAGCFEVQWSDGFGGRGLMNTDQGIGESQNHVFRTAVLINGILSLGGATIAAAWKGQLGYGAFERHVFPILSSGLPVLVADLPPIEFGTKGDPSFIPDNIDALPENRYDVLQAALEYVYLKQENPETEQPALAPIAGFTHTGGPPSFNFTDRSVDWDGTIASRAWDFGDGNTSTATNPSHTFAPGTYTVSLTVTDNDDLTDTITEEIVVPNVAPIATFSSAANVGDPTGFTVDFTDSSVDPDGSLAAWDWDFGDGSPHGTTQNPTHVYAIAGTYPVALVVTDNLGAASSPATASLVIPIVAALPDVGVRRNMPILFCDSADAGLNQSNERWDFSNTPIDYDAAGGRDGGGCVKEKVSFGDVSTYWQYTSQKVPPDHANECLIQFVFDLDGGSKGYSVPLINCYPTNLALALTADRHLQLWVDDGAFGFTFLGQSADPIAGSGVVVGHMRVKYDPADGFIWVRIGGTKVLDFVGIPIWNASNGQQLTSTAWGTGSGEDYSYPGTDPYFDGGGGIAGVRWMDFSFFDPHGFVPDDWSGDVHFDKSYAADAALTSDDGVTSTVALTAEGQVITKAIAAIAAVAHVLAVLPFFYHARFNAGAINPVYKLAVKSGAAESAIHLDNLSSNYTSFPHAYNNAALAVQLKLDRWSVPLDPNTAADWTPPNVSTLSLEATCEHLDVAGSNEIRISQLGVEFAYWID